MKKLVDDNRLIFKCCSLYYQDGMGQKDICELLGVSRPTVSRMLAIGKEIGIVKIEIVNPDNIKYGNVERAIEKKFGLKEVIIVQSSLLDEGRQQIDSEIGRATLKYLARIIEKDDHIGISMGLTLQNIVRTDCIVDDTPNCTFVPMVGGLGVKDLEIYPNYLVQAFAERFHGNAIQFFSPAVFSNRAVLEGFLQEESIKKIIKMYKKLDIALVGMGIPTSGQSTVFHTGNISHEILEGFKELGAAGDIALRYYDINGNTEKFQEFNDRVAGIRLENLKRVPRRIGVACGKAKIEAVIGAIHGGYINVLITDIDCAKGLLKYDK